MKQQAKQQNTQKRWHILVSGQVQGVGFRPFVYRLAHERALTGFVSNTSEGVPIEVQGNLANLESFVQALQYELPPLAKLTSCIVTKLAPIADEADFRILLSTDPSTHGHKVLISPDTSLCADCEAEMLDASNHRHLYAFTNCTNCGPRYTITHSIPYDRKSTSMACFALCATCQEEYDNPLDRRFHAQPNACPECGPSLHFVENAQQALNENALRKASSNTNNASNDMALNQAAKALLDGKIVAIKGLGGFHLACTALDADRIAQLRLRKNRPHKPFAIMLKDVHTAKLFAYISPKEESLLTGVEKPIVLCKRKAGLAQNLAPDSESIGIMLAYTPLHRALFAHLDALTDGLPMPLVMTSGNAGGEPICLGNREALTRLEPLADVFLLHNRDILVRTDDSVCAVHTVNDEQEPEQTVFYRRARGYVPRPVHVPSWSADGVVLGVGAELKSTLCLTRGQDAFVSQHIGNLQNIENLQFFQEVLAHMQMLLQVKPDVIVHDTHPDFLSTQLAKEYAQELNIPCYALQHHFAHAYAVLAEHDHAAPCLALSLDGTGLGDDGTIWGGELLYLNPQQNEHKRIGRLAPFALPGGEKAIQEPWRIAMALAQGTEFEDVLCAQFAQSSIVLEMINKKINCPATSSAGRLFDAVSAGLGLCHTISYEGQAAIRLESAQKNVHHCENILQFDPIKKADLWEISSQDLFVHSLMVARQKTMPEAAFAFHEALSSSLVQMVVKASEEYDIKHIALSGGVMQNASLHAMLWQKLRAVGFTMLTHKAVPPGDGGLSLGQAYFGKMCVKN